MASKKKPAEEIQEQPKGDKPLFVPAGAIRTPPFSKEARSEAGYLLRRLQQGEKLTMPQSETMPEIGPRCHQLRIRDETHNWRIVYRIDPDAIVVPHIFDKGTKKTRQADIETAKARLRTYDRAKEGT